MASGMMGHGRRRRRGAAGRRYLIVNAADFGQSPALNACVIEAHEHGIVTSASLMVRWPAASEAAAYARTHPELSLGLDVDLSRYAYRDGSWVLLYEVVPMDDASAIVREVYRQLSIFRRLTGRDPTHVDSHQHIHCKEPVRSVVVAIARMLGVPARPCPPAVVCCGAPYPGSAAEPPVPRAISAEQLVELFRTLPPGVTELCYHPGDGLDGADGAAVGKRSPDLDALCDPRVRSALSSMGIQLLSYGGTTGRTLREFIS
jgi:predicted glycoside hydrolase/deacetylase ChbG (UPF0249 family)